MANLTGSILGAAVVTLLEPVLRRTIHIDPAKASLVPARHLRRRARRAHAGAAAGRAPRGVLGVAPHPARAGAERQGRDGRDAGSRIQGRACTSPERSTSTTPNGIARSDARTCGRTRRSCSRRVASRRASAASSPPRTSTSISARARSPRSSGRTAPARPRSFNLLTGFIRPDRGSVKLNGTELVGLYPDKVARLGLVRSFQNVRLFNRISCVQNVMLAVQSQPGENVIKLTFGRNRAEAREDETPARRRWGG